MKKFSVFAFVSAIALAIAAAPAEAATKKKSKGSKAKVTVSKQAPVTTGFWASGFNNCASVGTGAWYPLAAVGAVGCGIVYAVPVMIEGFMFPQASKKEA
jgi:hypothetical protein